jgi:hypothetical protein
MRRRKAAAKAATEIRLTGVNRAGRTLARVVPIDDAVVVGLTKHFYAWKVQDMQVDLLNRAGILHATRIDMRSSERFIYVAPDDAEYAAQLCSSIDESAVTI